MQYGVNNATEIESSNNESNSKSTGCSDVESRRIDDKLSKKLYLFCFVAL